MASVWLRVLFLLRREGSADAFFDFVEIAAAGVGDVRFTTDL